MGAVERQKKPGQAWETVAADESSGQSMYVQDSDPGAVGTGKFWLDMSTITQTSLAILKLRNPTDSGWDPIMPAFYDAGPPETVAAMFISPGNVTIQVQDLTNNTGANLVIAVPPTQVELYGAPGQTVAIGSSPGALSFFGKNPSVTQPVVPQTTPGIQDVIDALVALGLVAQHD